MLHSSQSNCCKSLEGWLKAWGHTQDPTRLETGSRSLPMPCLFSPTCLLFQVISSLRVHMPGGEGQVGGRGDWEALSFPGYQRDTFTAMTGAWGEKWHLDCWVLMLFWTCILKACISKLLSDDCAILWFWAIRFWCSVGWKQILFK